MFICNRNIVIWFLTGLFAGWLLVKHIRTLEPGIMAGESRWVMLGWGVGAVISAILTGMAIGIISAALGV